MSKCHRVRSDTKLRAPLFRDGLGQASDSCLGEGIVGLPSIAVKAGRGGDVDDASRFAVFDAEVRGGGADQLEGGCSMERDYCIPLLIGGFVDDSIVGKAGVVDDFGLELARLLP